MVFPSSHFTATNICTRWCCVTLCMFSLSSAAVILQLTALPTCLCAGMRPLQCYSTAQWMLRCTHVRLLQA